MKLLTKEPPPPPPVNDTAALEKGKNLVTTARYYERLLATAPRRPSPSDRQKFAEYHRKAVEARAEAASLGYSEN